LQQQQKTENEESPSMPPPIANIVGFLNEFKVSIQGPTTSIFPKTIKIEGFLY
jgi:hypothetical protein